MRVFVFISTKDRNVLGFTANQSGSNLPPDYAPWEPAAPGGAVMVGSDPDAGVVQAGIRRDGFFLAVGGYEDEPRSQPRAH
jgi:hypothetical protein